MPLVACALELDCMYARQRAFGGPRCSANRKNYYEYTLCHRFDQAALTGQTRFDASGLAQNFGACDPNEIRKARQLSCCLRGVER